MRQSNERRRHVVYVTHHNEYHCRGQECVGVRDRDTGKWLRHHPALRGKIIGAMSKECQKLSSPREGLHLIISGKKMLRTSKIIFAGRPDKVSVSFYISQFIAGEILNPA